MQVLESMYFLAPAGGLCLFLLGVVIEVCVCVCVCVCIHLYEMYTFIYLKCTCTQTQTQTQTQTHTHTYTQGPTLMKKQDYIKPLESPLMFICAASLGVGVQVKKKAPHNVHV